MNDAQLEDVRVPTTESVDGTDKLTQRGRRTRSALVVAARTIFERDGFLNARITDISDAAGVAHGTFYTYFDSKEAAFRAVILDLKEELLQSATARAATQESPWAAIERANRRYLEIYREHAALMRIWEEVAILDDEVRALQREGSLAFAARAERGIRRLQAAGIVDPELDAAYAAPALTAMVSRFAYNWFNRAEPFDFEKVVAQLTRLWANALGVPVPGESTRP